MVKRKSSVNTWSRYIILLLLVVISTESFASKNICTEYDWGKVVKLVEPHLDENSHATLVMQGLSSEYNTSVAAYQAMNPKLPKEIYEKLKLIVKLNCP